MKLSRYNLFSHNEHGDYMFNTFSGGLLRMDEKHVYFLKNGQIDLLNDQEIKIMQENGFLVNEACDEIAVIRHFFRTIRYGKQGISLTIVPTLECNFACPYCYEKDMSGSMKDEIWQALLEYIKDNGSAYKKFYITFYGGEPLLEFKAIDRFLHEIWMNDRTTFDKFDLAMVTNGYLLIPEVVDKLAFYGFSGLQITIDGNREVHNKRRPHKHNNDSYERVVSNIHYAAQKLFINIRINMDKNNSEICIQKLLNDIGYPEGHKNISIYAAILTDVDEGQGFAPFNNEDFSKCFMDTFEQNRRITKKHCSLSDMELYPLTVACGADYKDTLVILPDGTLTNCWNNLASVKEVDNTMLGCIKDGKVQIFEDKLALWLEKTDLANLPGECHECPFLPVCLGGCPKIRFNGVKDCCYPKFWFERCLNNLLS